MTGSMEERSRFKKHEFAKSSLEEGREKEEFGERAQTFQTGPPKLRGNKGCSVGGESENETESELLEGYLSSPRNVTEGTMV